MRGLPLLLLAVFLLLPGCGRGGDWPPPTPALWQVTGPAGQQGWLFGTIHALPDGVEWRTPALDDALAAAGPVVVEIGAPDPAEVRALFAEVGRSPGLPPVTQRLPVADRPALAAALDRADLPESALDGWEDWAAALTLANALRTGDAANGVDRQLVSDATQLVALESAAGQFALFDALPAPQQAAMLRDAATGSDPAVEEARTRAWLAGDVPALEREAATGLLSDPLLRDTLQTGRNRAWLPVIARLLDEGVRPFVAVGAAHMIGPEGLPALLAARGYTVTRVQ